MHGIPDTGVKYIENDAVVIMASFLLYLAAGYDYSLEHMKGVNRAG